MKKLLIAIAVVSSILAAAAYLLLSNIDAIVKSAIESAGTEVLGTRVSVGEVSINLSEGRAVIRDLAVANPPGFSNRPAFRFGDVTAVVDISSGAVRRIETSEPDILVEFEGGRSNFEVLNRNIRAWAESGEGEEARDTAEDPIRIQIDAVEVSNARATVTFGDGEDPVEVKIGRLYFENLKGSPQQVARVMLEQFVAQVAAKTARRLLQEKAERYMELKRGELEEKIGSKLKELLN